MTPEATLLACIEDLAHCLPGQAPIRDFVHHNTLHGFQHLPFAEALAAAHALSSSDPTARAMPYWPESRFHEAYRAGRIDLEDLSAALDDAAHEPAYAGNAMLADLDQPLSSGLTRRHIVLASLLLPCPPSEETGTDLEGAAERCHQRFAQLGLSLTAQQLFLDLTGIDLLERVRSRLQGQLAAHLDLGMAAWSNPARQAGFYTAWKASAAEDPGWDIDDLPALRQSLSALPDEPMAALIGELQHLDLAQEHWPDYLTRSALALPGWSGMFLWRARKTGTAADPRYSDVPVNMVDYLAIRLFLERIVLQDHLARLAPELTTLHAWGQYLADHPAEYFVREHRGTSGLPEALRHRLAPLFSVGERQATDSIDWETLAREIACTLNSPERQQIDRDARTQRLRVLQARLAEIIAPDSLLPSTAWSAEMEEESLTVADALQPLQRRYLWLLAYERHYRETICIALSAQARHRRDVPTTPLAPSAQVVLCMDDREEGTRRHLEEIAPDIMTFGAAGFLGIAMFWQGLDEAEKMALCPVVMTPQHQVSEQAVDPQQGRRHAARRNWRLRWRERLYQATRRHALLGPLLTLASGLPALATLSAALLFPAGSGRTFTRWRKNFDLPLSTHIDFLAPPISAPPAASAGTQQAAHPALPGFALSECVDRVEDLLRTIGLTDNFAPLVLILGHGSNSRNNPHASAYDCGACAGRHGGPNARVFAAMANLPAVRRALASRGLDIPASTYFIAAEHNTCDDDIEGYDLDHVPASHLAARDTLLNQLAEACRRHALERCRRLASAPLNLTPWQALTHVRGRRHDLSQARPELGHATNAVALIGRRSLTQGLFLDRRAFLISYDPAADAEGAILEKTLLAVAPVGAGISLEYYFSTVDNPRYGCGSKVTHNLTGLFGVMEGADSDLRTGLPWQMVEIHEPMRLLVIIEQRTEVLTTLVSRQPGLQTLIGNAWLNVMACDPLSGALSRYCPQRGWLPWSGPAELPTSPSSTAWTRGQRDALPPALIVGAAHP